MTNLSDTLAALSEAATQGEWVIELDPYDAPFPGICPAGSPFEMASFTMGEDADENQANANFVVALVSAYRTGQLVPVPSVEAGARALVKSRRLHWNALNEGEDALVAAIKASIEGWNNVVEMGLLPPQHHDTARDLSDRLHKALASRGLVRGEGVERG